MKFSQFFINTLKETPKDAEVISHQLMIRAGMIKKVAAGLYSLTPLGLKVVRKFESIVREEMNRSGALEVLLPMVTPAELWQESGRWEKYGKELLRFTDRHTNEFCLGPTHEEVITDLVRHFVKSYKQMPINLYQIQTKFRDEIRPRFGLMRGREFIMKDAYSFHTNTESLAKTYEVMKDTYKRIFNRCGLQFKVVKADSGSIGGDTSAEFMVTASTGEDGIVECQSCDYAANVEAAESFTHPPLSRKPLPPFERVETPKKTSIKDVSAFLNIPEQDCIKACIYTADGNTVMALVRGNDEINEIKLKHVLNVQNLALTDAKTNPHIKFGYVGPVQFEGALRIVADLGIQQVEQGLVGANAYNFHFKGVVPDRDFNVDQYADIRNVQENDPCPLCKTGKLRGIRGIEVGHIFQLGTTYSKALKATFQNADKGDDIITMGCYGIGIGRTVAAAIEQNHDSYGIKWPLALAPFEVVLVVTNTSEEKLSKAASSLYELCLEKSVDVLLDDRDDVSAGFKFKDADLIGIPIQIIFGKQLLENDLVEIKLRQTGEMLKVPVQDVFETLKNYLNYGL